MGESISAGVSVSPSLLVFNRPFPIPGLQACAFNREAPYDPPAPVTSSGAAPPITAKPPTISQQSPAESSSTATPPAPPAVPRRERGPQAGECLLRFTRGLSGGSINVSADKIPPPPAFRVRPGMDGVADLDARWDWHGESYLILGGTPILIYYWRDLYRYRFPQRWSLIKSQWYRCEVSPAASE